MYQLVTAPFLCSDYVLSLGLETAIIIYSYARVWESVGCFREAAELSSLTLVTMTTRTTKTSRKTTPARGVTLFLPLYDYEVKFANGTSQSMEDVNILRRIFLIVLVCVPFDESKNKFLILDLPDFAAERNAKSDIGSVPLLTFRNKKLRKNSELQMRIELTALRVLVWML